MVTMAELRPIFERREREDRFWPENYGRFLEQYPDQFVAAREGVVVATAPSIAELVSILSSKGIAPTDLSVQWVSERLACLVL